MFAREGADIAILYLEEDQDAEITKQLVEREGQHCLLLKGDISDPDVAKLDIDKVLQHYGKINILVNNAGVQYQQKEIESISNEQLEKTFKTNIFPMFYLTKKPFLIWKKVTVLLTPPVLPAIKAMMSSLIMQVPKVRLRLYA